MISSDRARVAVAHPTLRSDCGRILWSLRTGRFQELSDSAAAVFAEIEERDGCQLAELKLEPDAHRALCELADAGLVEVWDDQEGLPLSTADVAWLVLLNWCARIILAVAGNQALRRLTSVDGEGAAESQSWRGLRGEQLVAASRAAGALPFVDSRCLPSALAIRWKLVFEGQEAKLRIAAISTPFEAHAWVELDGNRLDPAPIAFPARPFRKG